MKGDLELKKEAEIKINKILVELQEDLCNEELNIRPTLDIETKLNWGELKVKITIK